MHRLHFWQSDIHKHTLECYVLLNISKDCDKTKVRPQLEGISRQTPSSWKLIKLVDVDLNSKTAPGKSQNKIFLIPL